MNHLFSLPPVFIPLQYHYQMLFSLPKYPPSITEGSRGRGPYLSHLSTSPPFPAFLFPLFSPLNQSSGWRMVTVGWLHSTHPLLTPSLLAPGDITKYCCLRGSELFPHFFQEGFSLSCFAVCLCLILSFLFTYFSFTHRTRCITIQR